LVCPACHKPNPESVSACASCGRALVDLATVAINQPQDPSDSADATRIDGLGQARAGDVRSNDLAGTVGADFDQKTITSNATATGIAAHTKLDVGVTVAGRYLLERRLGEGGMGAVYRAQDLELGRVIALKTIRPELSSNSSLIKRFKQELLLSRQITHRNVVRIFDFIADGDMRYITMELVEGEELRRVLDRRGRLPIAETVQIIKQIAAGLHAAHLEGIIHRDLKPQNIMLDQRGQIRIMDFGLARSLEHASLTQTIGIMGTPDYMSPEQALGEELDARSDLFATGLIFYEMLTGERAFAAESMAATLVKRTRERALPPIALNPETPQELSDIVMRCLESQRSARYQSIPELLKALDARDWAEAPTDRVASGPLEPNRMLGSRYRIIKKVGEGGMGTVYRAIDIDLNRTVALKIVRAELVSDPASLERLKQEILLASRISHRHVLRIHDLGEADGLRFISMAWMDGEDLEQLIRQQGSFSEQRIIQIGEQLCLGLEAAHLEGVVHRDLKPANILLDEKGQVCIADFGLAQSIQATPSTQTSGGVSGTPLYMSPEQIEGKEVGQASDLFSLGLILYEMATGELPFRGDSAISVMLRRVMEPAKDPKLINPALSDRLSGIILRCLERDPKDRYPSVASLRADLCAPPVSTETTNVPPVSVRSPRRLWKYGIAGASALLAICGVMVWQRQRVHTPVGESLKNGKYIAVLPFRPLGEGSNIKFDAEGLGEAVSSRLLSLGSVHPISAQALERVDLKQSEDQIAKQVGANLLVRGSVQEENEKISINVKVDNIETSKTVWSGQFGGIRKDLFTLQDQVSNSLALALAGEPNQKDLERTPLKPTQDLAAYDLYLAGREILKNRRDADSARAALKQFQAASDKDASFALAWTGVADSSLLLYRITKDPIWSAKAVSAAQEAAQRNDRLPEVHFALGSAYTATGKNAQAVEEIQRALQLAPNSDDGYVRLGRAYLATGQREASLAAFKKAVELNPYYWYNHKQLGAAFAQFGRNQDALAEFKEQSEQNPQDASGFSNMGAIQYKLGLLNESIPQFKKALELHASYDVYSNLGTVYQRLGRFSEAVPMFERAVELNPGQAVAVRNLAEAYRAAGKLQQAAENFSIGIKLAYSELQVNPQNTRALLDLAICYAGNRNMPKALETIRRARSIDADDSELASRQAALLALNNQLPEAEVALRQALKGGYSREEAAAEPDLKAVLALLDKQAK
jgi:serine/threonine protein kinase/tetratricopeptide (TPR) repeat protein